jgi:hypothetical protein
VTSFTLASLPRGKRVVSFDGQLGDSRSIF